MTTTPISVSQVSIRLFVVLFITLWLGVLANSSHAEETTTPAAKPVTTSDPQVDVDLLQLMLKPLTKDELVVEADAWQGLLQETVAHLSEAELRARGGRPANDSSAGEAVEAKSQEESPAQWLEIANERRERRTIVADRFGAVLDELEVKGGEVESYQLYLSSVTGINVDVTDTSAVWTAVQGWLLSSEGGLRMGKNLILFLVTLIAAFILSIIAGKATRRAISKSTKLSSLLRHFLETMARRTVLFVGLLVALSMLEINVGPFLAAIGAAGFVIAFALQGTLSNFASGILILFYRPFDVGDLIDVSGSTGVVESMNLMTTIINTLDNQRVIVPNNAIWGGVITNITGNPTRRIDLIFGISYTDDMAKAKSIMDKILADHPKVLDNPQPTVAVCELGDSSVNFVCRPWVKTADYWEIYWDVTRLVKEQFDAQGVSIPFPQRDVHLFSTSDQQAQPMPA